MSAGMMRFLKRAGPPVTETPTERRSEQADHSGSTGDSTFADAVSADEQEEAVHEFARDPKGVCVPKCAYYPFRYPICLSHPFSGRW
jgi:hypothetical protein